MGSFINRARDAATKASDAAKSGAQQAKERGPEMSLKRKLGGLAEDLGQTVFRQAEGEGGLEAEIDRLVAEMRGIQAEIDGVD